MGTIPPHTKLPPLPISTSLTARVPPPSETLNKALEIARYLHPTVRSHLLHPVQPAECRAAVGAVRAANKCAAFERIREENAKMIRAASQKSSRSRTTQAQAKKAFNQRLHVQEAQRRVASEAARRYQQNTSKIDDIVEAVLVSTPRSVKISQRERVVKGLEKLLPVKKRPPLV